MKQIILLVLLVFSAALAQPNGTFIVGESEGDDFERLLTISDGAAEASPLSAPEQSERFQLSRVGEGLYYMRGEGPEPARGYLRFRSDDEALIWFSGSSRLFWALRKTDQELAPLQGEWKALVGDRIESAKVEQLQFTLGSEDRRFQAALHPVAGLANEMAAVAIPEGRESFLLYFVQLEPELWLVRNHEEDNFVLMFRGDGPPWMKAELESRQNSRGNMEETSSKSSR